MLKSHRTALPPSSLPPQNAYVSDDTLESRTSQGGHSRETVGYAGTAFCLNGWDKARLSLDSASAVVLVGTALTVYTIIAMSHPLLLRHSPTLATQPPSTAAQQKGAKKVQLCGKSGFTWWREVHWQSSCEEQRFGRFRVRQQNTSGQTLPNPRRPSNYRLAPMNSALSGDERTRRYGDTGMGASRTLGTSPPRVTTGPWPSLPAGALF